MALHPMTDELRDLLTRQDGVVARRQALAAGLRQHDIDRLRRRREWVVLHPGVYVDHTGVPTWQQRAWAGVLAHWPAALWGPSALRAGGTGVIHVAIDRSRATRAPLPGVRVHHVVRLTDRVRWNLGPPRMTVEDATLDTAAGAADDLAAVAVLTAACADRRTTPRKLVTALAARARMPRRAWVSAVLADAEAGTHSVLERRYRELERAHGLPTSVLQQRGSGPLGVVYRDASYEGGAVVELDGRAFHSSWEQRERDLARDLELAAAGGATVRLGYRQVFGDGCATVGAVARFLRARGVTASARSCGPDCPVT